MPTIGLPTLIVLAIAAAGALLVGLRSYTLPLAVLLVGVGLRDFTSRWLFTHTDLTISVVTAIGRWWFALILGLLAVLIWRWVRTGERGQTRSWLHLADYLLVVVGAVAVISTLLSSNFGAAFTSLRGYVQPMGVYLLARAWRPSRASLKWMLGILLVLGIVMGLFGVWQGATWNETEYRAAGYVRQNGELVTPPVQVAGNTYLRPASTVSGPNELAIDMVVMFSLAFMTAIVFGGRVRVFAAAAAVVMSLGLIVTFSRSGFLGYLLVWSVLLMLAWRLRDPPGQSRDRRVSIRALGILIAVLAIAGVAFSLSGFFELIGETIQGLSSQYHIRDTVEAVQFLVEQPQGVGMGLVEPKGALNLIELGGTYHVEGSLLQVAMEMGVWGLAVWLIFWLISLWAVARNVFRVDTPILRVFSGAALAGWLGSLAAFVFLPLMQSISLMVWLWFLLGLGVAAHDVQMGWNRDHDLEIWRLADVSNPLGESN